MDLGLKGKRAAVAAGSAGLGLGTARALVEAGARVAICGRDSERLAGAAQSLGESALPLAADVSTVEGATAFVEAAQEGLGGLDILVTNAGGPPPGNFASTDLSAYPEALSLNLLSVVAMCTAALPTMQAQGWGRILAITTVGVREPLPGMVYSNVARTGLTAYLKQLSREVIRDGVTVNSLLPNSHRTARLERMIPDLQGYEASLVSGRIGRADDFGQVAAFLCSAQANYITGVALPVDGGSGTALA